MGFLRSLRDVKKFALRYEFKRGFEGVYSFARFALVWTCACLANFQKCPYNTKSVYEKISIYGLYRKIRINTLGKF